MIRSSSPVALAVTFAWLSTAGCGSNADSPGAPAVDERGTATATGAAPSAHVAADPLFEPAADQFGLQRFTIVTRSHRAPVKVGLRTRRESSETLTRYVEGYGERVAMELRSDNRHELYLWDGERGLLRDLATGMTTDQGGVRLKRSRPDPRAVASAAQLGSWGYRPEGRKSVLGRPCERWSSREQRTEFCRWRHLVLESREYDADGNETGSMSAIEINEGAGIPASFASLADRP